MHDGPDGGQRAGDQGGAPMLTNRATAVLAEAAHAARRFGHVALGTEHLMLGLLAEGTVRPLLDELGLDPVALEAQLREAILHGKAVLVAAPAATTHVRRALQLAEAEARRGGSSVEPEHLLLALVATHEGVAPELLQRAGITLAAARNALTLPR